MTRNMNHQLIQEDAKNDLFANQVKIQKATGSRLYGDDGKFYLDLSSQNPYNLIGHNIKEIQEALQHALLTSQQVSDLPSHHDQVINLCEKIQKNLPDTSQWRIEFAASASLAIDSALKTTYDYWHSKNQTKRRTMITFAYAHHGNCSSSINLNASFNNHNAYEDFLIPVEHIPYPSTWHLDKQIEFKEELSIIRLEEYLKENHHNCAGFILEPLLQSHNGMQACRPIFLDKVIQLVQKYKLIVISDERYLSPMRSGLFLASQYLSHKPDIIIIGNNLTNNIVPLGTMIYSEKINSALNRPSIGNTINHLACATANKTIDILEQKMNAKQIQKIQETHALRLNKLNKQPIVKNIRYLGSIGAFDIICEDRSKQKQLIDWFYKSSMEKRFSSSAMKKMFASHHLYVLA